MPRSAACAAISTCGNTTSAGGVSFLYSSVRVRPPPYHGKPKFWPGAVMRLTNSRLAVDSSLDVSDAKLVRPGNRVINEEQDLGIRAGGTVTQVADTPGTNRVDPSRFYFAVAPKVGFPQLVGTSVKLTIAVKSTHGRVLAVPPSALSVGGNGSSRVQVADHHGNLRQVNVVPVLAAEGLVEVRPAGHERLAPGDLVVVGTRGGILGSTSTRGP